MFLNIIDINQLPERMRRLFERYDELPEHAKRMVEALIRKRVNNKQWLSSRPESMVAQNIRLTKQISLEKTGELEVIVDGGQVKILTDSIIDRLIRNVFETYLGGGRKSARTAPAHVARKSKRQVPPRTEAQLRGLSEGNARRREEARRRRQREEKEVAG
jgi:hypothetical protein